MAARSALASQNAQRQRHLPSGGTARRDGHLCIWYTILFFGQLANCPQTFSRMYQVGTDICADLSKSKRPSLWGLRQLLRRKVLVEVIKTSDDFLAGFTRRMESWRRGTT